MAEPPVRSAQGQAWQPEGYQRHAGFVAELGQPVLEMLAPKAGQRVLDLGCGDGRLTELIAAAGAIVVGVDASAEMVEAARRRGLDARQVDGHALAFAGEFDAVFSNAALHWMLQPDAVLEGVHRALRPGGRFVGEFGGFGNVAAIRTAIRAVLRAERADAPVAEPWYFPTAAEYAERLQAHGFAVESVTLLPRPTPLPTGMAGWLETFAGPFFAGRTAAETAALVERVIELLRPSLCDGAGGWFADYVRLRFAARRRD